MFCAWLAWSRFRVVVPLRDKTMPSVVIGLDRTLRAIGGGSDLRADGICARAHIRSSVPDPVMWPRRLTRP